MSAPRRTTLRSSELSCPSCITKIQKELEGVEGVASAEIHFSSGRIVVNHDEERASQEQLVAAIARAGYSAKVRAF